MRNLFTLLPILCFMIVSCYIPPHVTTQILRNYEPIDPNIPILVYELKDEVIDSAQIIAVISITDKGNSTKCKYPEVIDHAVEETRKVGGHAFKVTNHTKPNAWKSSCHQIWGTALRIQDFDSLTFLKPLDNFTMKDFNRLNQMAKMKYANAFPGEISFNLGYGNVINRTKGISGDEKAYENNMSNGFSWDINLTRVYRRGFGWGIIYSGYTSSTNYLGANHRSIITYIAPMFVGKGESRKWVYKYKFGIGYLGYRFRLKEGGQRGYAIGRNAGLNYGFGIDYKLSERIGLGIEASAIAGSFTSLK